MSNFMKFFVLLTLAVVAGAYVSGCAWKSSKSAYRYACATPIGELQITPETDQNIRLANGVLHASREGKSIMIPFQDCVAIKDGSQ